MAGATTSDHGVDLAAVSAWMDTHDLGGGRPVRDAVPLSGGTQNVMVRFRRGERAYVLRRGPLHLRAHTNRAMEREMRVLAALADTDVPHPALIAACRDEQVLDGAFFYLMEPVDGFNASIELIGPAASDPAHRHAMGLSMADALARLATVDHIAVGLGDVGNPEGFLERQVSRWLEEKQRYSSLEGYPGFTIDGVDEVAAWLDAHRPATWTPGLMHGDFHIANVMFAPREPRVAAVIDWEMCTIGDPMLDLGWFVASWPGGKHELPEIGGELGRAGALPSIDELLAVYAERSGRDVSQVGWYRVMACFKLGIVLESTYARACAGQAPKEYGDRLHRFSVSLFAQARELISCP